MKSKKNIYDDYDSRLLKYITEYAKTNGVPPSVDLMIENVEGKTSKSTVYHRLQGLVQEGLLVQKNVKGYYYPTSLITEEILIPKTLVNIIYKSLTKHSDQQELANELHQYLKE